MAHGPTRRRAPSAPGARGEGRRFRDHLSIGGRHFQWTARPDRWASWRFDGVRRGLRLIAEFRPDVLFSTFPIATAHVIGAELNRRTGIPWVADFRDPMAQDGYPSDPQTWRAYKRIEERAIQQASLCLFTTPGAARDYRARYREAAPRLEPAISAFPPSALREWSAALGQPTFVGSSGRVFPKAFKASPLLRAWLRRLDAMGVKLALRHRWTGWDEQGRLHFQTPDGPQAIETRATVLTLGGASWPRLGSDGAWAGILADRGVKISPLRPANCGFTVAWSNVFRERFEGQPLKGTTLSFGSTTARGEATITRNGIEGGAIYALSAELREAIHKSGEAMLHIALRPDLDPKDLIARLTNTRSPAGGCC